MPNAGKGYVDVSTVDAGTAQKISEVRKAFLQEYFVFANRGLRMRMCPYPCHLPFKIQ